jgi:electron transport complex protein RnfG
MKDILTIIFRLTITCILAATVMGSAFIITNKAKKHNEHVNEQKVRYSLLGYSAAKPIPESMALHEMYRYVVTDKESQAIGYLLPGKEGFFFLTLDMEGKVIANKPVDIAESAVLEKDLRDKVVQEIAGAGKSVTFADQTIIVTNNGQRVAYLLDGKFTGFKTFIGVMLAVDPKFSILGLEILEHEEDPGLGAEIERDYFRNQFKGKTFDQLKDLDVVKEPLPDEYFQALEGNIAAADAAKILAQYGDRDIYALTGATISSRYVNTGVKSIVKKFAYRLNILDTALAEQKIKAAF